MKRHIAPFLAGAVLAACATGVASDRFHEARKTVYTALAKIGNDVCTARTDPLVAVARIVAFSQINTNLEQLGAARWSIDGIQCHDNVLPDSEPSSS